MRNGVLRLATAIPVGVSFVCAETLPAVCAGVEISGVKEKGRSSPKFLKYFEVGNRLGRPAFFRRIFLPQPTPPPESHHTANGHTPQNVLGPISDHWSSRFRTYLVLGFTSFQVQCPDVSSATPHPLPFPSTGTQENKFESWKGQFEYLVM